MQVREENRRKKEIEKKVMSEHKPSKFLETIFEEESRQKRKSIEKTAEHKTFHSNKFNYAQKVREEHRATIKRKTAPIPNPVENDAIRQSKSLSNMDLQKLGNDYMRKIHSSISSIEVENSKVGEAKSPQQQPYKYPDYLQEIKRSRMVYEEEHPNPETKEIKEIKELKKLIHKETPIEDKFYQAKIIAKKLDQRASGNPNMMVNSINAKIEILNAFLLGQEEP